MRDGPIVPKRFQQDAIENTVEILSNCLSQIIRVQHTAHYKQSRRLIVGETGYVLIEAPTGTGKTFMASRVMEWLSSQHPILWFWFAPFAGLTGQAQRHIQRECAGLRARSLETERDMDTDFSGCIYILTWASVATRKTSSRLARQGTETLPSIDQMLEVARQSGVLIGTVVDEAHHSFRAHTEAFSFFRDVLDPDVTILATATPRDEDVNRFVRVLDIHHPNRISISRQQGVEAGLIKQGVHAFSFRTHVSAQGLIDFRKTALERGVQAHNRIKEMLSTIGVSMTPLLLVQADSSPDSIPTIVEWLGQMGFSDDQVRTHTADEPDPHLLTIASDETVEVLVFKMAVATGFDAPRAFTLVSMRTSRDPQFGIQIVGRIMRVDRRLQERNIPDALMYGYVFLSVRESQVGLVTAAQRINAIRDELAEVSRNVSVVELELNEPRAVPTPGGQLSGIGVEDEPDPPERVGDRLGSDRNGDPRHPGQAVQGQFAWLDEWIVVDPEQQPRRHRPNAPDRNGEYRYPLRTSSEFPRVFKRARTAVIPADQFRDELANRIRLDDHAMNRARQSAVQILMETTEIFGGRGFSTEHVLAPLAQKEIAKRAQAVMFASNENGMVDLRDLQAALIKRFREECVSRGWSDMLTDDGLFEGLQKILALQPRILVDAVSETLANHMEVVDGTEIPDIVVSDEPLLPSRLNVYGVMPPDLNAWELAFAQELDADEEEIVQWWYRNPSRKPYSVCLPLPGQPNFYPDFIVGVKGRIKGDGILLVETKRVINDEPGNAAAKAQAVHPVYRKVMMLYQDQDHGQWQTVEYNKERDQNVRDMVFRLELMRTYG